jgi:hypothetical protein
MWQENNKVVINVESSQDLGQQNTQITFTLTAKKLNPTHLITLINTLIMSIKATITLKLSKSRTSKILHACN